MKKYLDSFLLMIQILTRIPINRTLPCENDGFKRGSNFFVLVGLIIGIIQYFIFHVGINFFNLQMAVIFIILSDIFITGGFHLDGFGDTCDGFFATKGKDKIIDIMKDSRIGTFACIGIIMNLLIKYVSYEMILTYYPSGKIIILVPMLSRCSVALISYLGKPAKEKGTGNYFINNIGFDEVLVNYVMFIIIGAIIGSIVNIVFVIPISILITILFNKYCESKINGITGDSLGATNEVIVLSILIFLLVRI